MSSNERDRWVDKEVPDFFEPTALLLDRHVAGGRGLKAAFSVDAQDYSFAELLEIVKDHSGKLVSAGARCGERVFLFGRDSLEYIAYWLASVRIGAVPVVISDAYRAGDLLYFLQDTGARTLIIDGEQLGKLEAIAEELPASLKSIIVREPDAGPAGDLARLRAKQRQVVLHGALAIDPDGREEHASVHKDDLAYMFYSGGTTGRAKGITHVASDFIHIPERQGAYWQYRQSDVVHATSKKYFTHGLWPGVLIPLYWGAHSLVSRKDPTPENVIALIQSKRPSKWITVPTVIKSVVVHVRESGVKPDFSSIELAVTASEKMPVDFFEQFHRLFGIEMLDSIGSAEVTYEWIANRPGESRRGSLGKPVFGYEVRLRDGDGNIVDKPGVKGQAEVRSATGTPFYWRKRALSDKSIVDRWIRTGDELYFDEDGFYWFGARSNDVFKVKGLWVSPLEIEDTLVADPRVREAAVVPYQDQDGLTKPLAYLVLEPGVARTAQLEAELGTGVKDRLGGYKVPGRFAYIDQLPKTTLLKVDRKALRDQPPA